MIGFKHKGNFDKTNKFFVKVKDRAYLKSLPLYAEEGRAALAAATPKDTGNTAESWTYDISANGGQATINWGNTNVNDGVNIAVILQYGHGTGTGGYVPPNDYINPAMKPVFDHITEEFTSEVIET